MWTGRQTMTSIESAIGRLAGEESRIDAALQQAVGEVERLRRERTDALRELARVKLDEITAGRLVRNLDAAERRAVQVLDDRRHRIAGLAERRDVAVAEMSAAETVRHGAGAAVEQALAAVEAIRREAENRVQTSAAWTSARAAFVAADGVAGEAEKKAGQSETELGAKRKPYDDDPLFTYLWRHKFGTSAYAAGNITRMIDGWLARFVGFADARANYAMLIEIPVRLREHATGRRTVATGQQQAVAAIEREAMVAAGIGAKEAMLVAARHKLAGAEATLDQKRLALAGIDKERAALAGGGGEPGYAEALGTIAEGDARDDLATLYEEARRTATPADERLVRGIETIDTQLAGLEKELGEMRLSARTLANRRTEVEATRERFRSAGYDHPHATFGNEMDIGRILEQVLAGAVRSGVLWDVLRGGYSSRAPQGRPDFGAPTFPFPFPMPGGGNRDVDGGAWRDPGTSGGWTASDSGGGSGGGPGGGSGGSDDNFSTGGTI